VSRRRRPLQNGAALTALALLAACATSAPLLEGGGPDRLQRLPGWAEEDHAAAFGAVRAACAAEPPRQRPAVCADVLASRALGDEDARVFLERHYKIGGDQGEGLLTGYYSPSYDARSRPDSEFSAPVRPAPRGGDAGDRAAIEAAPADDALAWMRPEDLFFMQVQGSGDLSLDDGRHARAIYAGSNDRPYVAIGKWMVASGAKRDGMSLHDWLAAHRGPDAQAVMDRDPRYVYFKLDPDDGGEPRGAAGARLIPGRSLAVDPGAHAYFDLFWIDAQAPTIAGAKVSYQRLAVALDRGAAIKGPARADLYTGRGAAAGDEAGRVRHTLHLWRIVPAQP
jgi:membrane-bound lytic murein transglycosylase A